jgi:hypothetical protein
VHLVHLDGNRDRTLFTPAAGDAVQVATAPAVSRDGRWVAIPTWRQDVPEGPNLMHIIALADGAARAIGLGGQWLPMHLTWHPDGRHLLSLDQDGGNVVLLSLDSGAVRPLDSGAGARQTLAFALSPAGDKIAYTVETGLTRRFWELELEAVLKQRTGAVR